MNIKDLKCILLSSNIFKIDIFLGFIKNLSTHKYTLLKNSINELPLPKTIETFEDNIEYQEKDLTLIESEIKDNIINFRNVLEKNIDKEYLKLFYKNIDTLKIKKHPFGFLFKYTEAYYKVYLNEIVFCHKNYKNDIYHELFHLATGYVDNDTNIFIGFSQLNEDDEVGYGINEGYTELLTKRFFPDTTESYDFQKYVLKHIENIIGKDKMYELYFNSNLKGLIDELSKYLDVSLVFELINGLDLYTKLSNKIETRTIIDFANAFTYRVQDILLKAYICKYKEKLLDKSTTKDEILENINLFKTSLAYQISYKNNYFIFDIEKENDLIYDEYFKEKELTI